MDYNAEYLRYLQAAYQQYARQTGINALSFDAWFRQNEANLKRYFDALWNQRQQSSQPQPQVLMTTQPPSAVNPFQYSTAQEIANLNAAVDRIAGAYGVSREEAASILRGEKPVPGTNQYVPAPGTGVPPSVQIKPGLDWETLEETIRANKAREELERGRMIGKIGGIPTLEAVQYANEILANPQNAALAEQIRKGYALGDIPGQTVADYLKRTVDNLPKQVVGAKFGAELASSPPAPSPQYADPTPERTALLAIDRVLREKGKSGVEAMIAGAQRLQLLQQVIENPSKARFLPLEYREDLRLLQQLGPEGYLRRVVSTEYRRRIEDFPKDLPGYSESEAPVPPELPPALSSAPPPAPPFYGFRSPEEAMTFSRQIGQAAEKARAEYAIQSPGGLIAPTREAAERHLAGTMQNINLIGSNAYRLAKVPEPPPSLSSALSGQVVDRKQLDRELKAYQQEVKEYLSTFDQVQLGALLKTITGKEYAELSPEEIGVRLSQYRPYLLAMAKDPAAKVSDPATGQAVPAVEVILKNEASQNPNHWYNRVLDPYSLSTSSPYGVSFTPVSGPYVPYSVSGRKQGGRIVVGGEPHWIVDNDGNPVAAITEDGKPEEVKAKGKLEVIPLDPSRRRQYQRIKHIAGGQEGMELRNLNSLRGLTAGPSRRTAPSRRPGKETLAISRTRAVLPDGTVVNTRPPEPTMRAFNGLTQNRYRQPLVPVRAVDQDARSILSAPNADRLQRMKELVRRSREQRPPDLSLLAEAVRERIRTRGPLPVMVRTPDGRIVMPEPGVVAVPVQSYKTGGSLNLRNLSALKNLSASKNSLNLRNLSAPKNLSASKNSLNLRNLSALKGWANDPRWQAIMEKERQKRMQNPVQRAMMEKEAFLEQARQQGLIPRDNQPYRAGDYPMMDAIYVAANNIVRRATGTPLMTVEEYRGDSTPPRGTPPTAAVANLPVVAAGTPPTAAGANPPVVAAGAPPAVTQELMSAPPEAEAPTEASLIASGGPRVIGPGLRTPKFGFAWNALPYIAGKNTLWGVKNLPGVFVRAPHKWTPREIAAMTPADRTMLESYIRGAGQDPSAFYAQLAAATPRAPTFRRFIS